MKNTSTEIFRQKYLAQLPEDFHWQETPVQVYPLEFISKYILFPTPILKSDYYYLVFLSSGEYQQQVGNEIYHLNAPSMVFVPEGMVYAIKALDEKVSGYFIQIENKVMPTLISKGELPKLLAVETVIKLKDEGGKWLQNISELLYDELSSPAPNPNVGRGLLKALLHKLIEFSSGKKDISRQREIAVEFKQLVNKNYSEQKRVSFYAETMGISENYLNRCVKSEYNRSCKQIILETAIYQSEILMFYSSEDVSEISYQVGFEDPSHFTRLFKKITGRTPTEFKKQTMQDMS